jgi:hypothetical protein
LSDENIKKEILGFELNNITENQDGVDEATGKLTQILHSISDKACKTFIRERVKNKIVYILFFSVSPFFKSFYTK